MTVVCIKLKIGRKEAATWVTMTQKVKLLPVPGWGNFGMLMSNRQLVHNRDADAKIWLMYYGLQAESSLWLFQVTTCRGRGTCFGRTTVCTIAQLHTLFQHCIKWMTDDDNDNKGKVISLQSLVDSFKWANACHSTSKYWMKKKHSRETQTLRAGCIKVDPKIFTMLQTPFPGA